MSQSAGLNQRLDPYKNYKLRLIFNNRTYSGGIRTGLVPPPDPVDYRPGDDPSTHPRQLGRSQYEPITLNRGVTQDPSFSNWANQASSQGKYPPIPVDRGFTKNASFSSWASQVLSMGSSLGSEVSSANFRKNVLLEFYNEAGQLVVSYRLNGNQVSETQSRPPAIYQHFLRPGGPGTLQEQLAAIFENSLRRSTG
jgi:hypothetical protein